MKRLFAMVVLVLALTALAFADTGYVCTILPLPAGYPQGMTTAITNQGVITGYYLMDWTTRWQDCHACYWQNGQCIPLPNVQNLPTIALGASPSAILVEAYQTNGTPYCPFLFSHGRMIAVSDPWHRGAILAANAINNSNQVVGSYETADHHRHAFLWSLGLLYDLGTLGGTDSCANGLNDSGEVVGWSTTTNGLTHAFLWKWGRMTDLGTLDGSTSSANAINNSGQIVGSADIWVPSQQAYHPSACLWENGKVTDLGILEGGKDSYATAINNEGQITGYSDSGEQADFVCLWNSQGLVDELIGPKIPAGYAGHGNGINDLGQIVSDTAYNSSMYSTNPLPILWQLQ